MELCDLRHRTHTEAIVSRNVRQCNIKFITVQLNYEIYAVLPQVLSTLIYTVIYVPF